MSGLNRGSYTFAYVADDVVLRLSGQRQHNWVGSVPVRWRPNVMTGGSSEAGRTARALADFLARGRLSDAGPSRTGPSSGTALFSQLAPWLGRVALMLLIAVVFRWVSRAPQRRNRVALLATVAMLLIIVLDVI